MIFKQARRVTFTTVDNKALRDPRLSFKATGLLAFLLSLPDEWTPNSNHLAGVKTDGRDSVRAGLRELEAAGYLVRTRRLLPNRTFDWLIEVHEHPVPMDGKPVHGEVKTGLPWTGNPTSGNPAPGNPSSKEALRLTTDEGTIMNGEDDENPLSMTAGAERLRSIRQGKQQKKAS